MVNCRPTPSPDYVLPYHNPDNPPPLRSRGRVTHVRVPWWLSPTGSAPVPQDNKLRVLFLSFIQKLPLTLAVICLSTTNLTIGRLLYLTTLTHLSTITYNCRTTQSLIQTLTILQFLTPLVEPVLTCLFPVIWNITLYILETRSLSLIFGQLFISLFPPIYIDPQTIIMVVIALGTHSHMGLAVKAITLSPLLY